MIAYAYSVVAGLAFIASTVGVVLLAVEGIWRLADWWRRG